MLSLFTLPEILYGEKVILRKRDHNYDEEMWQAIKTNRDFLKTYLSWADKTNSIDDVIIATKHFTLAWASQAKFVYVITDRHSQKLLGSIDLHNIDFENHSAEIGYWLRKEKTGFGYMSEALNLIEHHAFEFHIHRLSICCDSRNRASANVALRNGYTFENTNYQAIYNNSFFYNREIYAKINPKEQFFNSVYEENKDNNG